MQSIQQLQIKIKEKAKASIEKRKDLYFVLLRVAVYLWAADRLIKIPKQGTIPDIEYYFSLFEAVNYLVVLAIILLLPTLDDIRRLRN